MGLVSLQHTLSNGLQQVYNVSTNPETSCDLMGYFAYSGMAERLQALINSNNCLSFLNSSSQGVLKYKLTPLHLAVMNGQDKSIEVLCKAGANPNKGDYKDYTPYHMAALRLDSTAKRALEAYCPLSEEKQTVYGATPKMLQVFQRYDKSPTCEVPFLWSNESQFSMLGPEDNPRDLFEPACLPKDWIFVNEYVASQSHLIDQWLKHPKPFLDDPLPGIEVASAYETFLQQHPKVKIKEVQVDTSGNSLDQPVGCGVFAEEAIKRGQIVLDYKSEMVDESIAQDLSHDQTYLFDEHDGLYYRGIGAFANDGVPNILALSFPGKEGQTRAPVFIALRDIKKGEQLLWDYGRSYFGKIGPRAELAQKELEDIFSSKSKSGARGFRRLYEQEKYLQIQIQRAEKRGKKAVVQNLILKLIKLRSDALYPLNTPQAFFHLIRKRLVTTQDMHFLFDLPDHALGISKMEYNSAYLSFFSLAKTYELLLKIDTKKANQVMDVYRDALKNFYVDLKGNIVTAGVYVHTAVAFDDFLQILMGMRKNFSEKKFQSALEKLKQDLVMDPDVIYDNGLAIKLVNPALQSFIQEHGL